MPKVSPAYALCRCVLLDDDDGLGDGVDVLSHEVQSVSDLLLNLLQVEQDEAVGVVHDGLALVGALAGELAEIVGKEHGAVGVGLGEGDAVGRNLTLTPAGGRNGKDGGLILVDDEGVGSIAQSLLDGLAGEGGADDNGVVDVGELHVGYLL